MVRKSRQVPYEDPVYKQVPVYQTYYVYRINRWQNVTPRVAEGVGVEARWPSQDLENTGDQIGCFRLGSREQTYTLTVRTQDDEQKTYTLTLDFDRWKELNDGRQMVARIRVGNIEKLMTPEEAAAE
jgi:hypothetical protein